MSDISAQYLKKIIARILEKEGLIPGTEAWSEMHQALEIRFMFAGPCDELSPKGLARTVV